MRLFGQDRVTAASPLEMERCLHREGWLFSAGATSSFGIVLPRKGLPDASAKMQARILPVTTETTTADPSGGPPASSRDCALP